MQISRLRFIPAIAWFLFVTVLFLLPGEELPHETWFERIYLDKLVHIIFIFILVYLFYLAFGSKKWLVPIAVAAIVYGLAIELIQLLWIAGRSFEWADLACDVLGCAAAYLLRRLQLA